MNVSGPFIRRPVATSLLALGLLLCGIVAFCVLPIAPLPQMDYPTINVISNLPGADPVTVATSVSAPLERRFAQIAGVDEMTSTSALGGSNVSVQFGLDRLTENAERDVQAAINAAIGDLPTNLVTRPYYRNFNPADSPVLILTLSSDTMPMGEVYNYGFDVVAQELSQIEGVSQVQVSGAQKSAVRVQVDPARLAGMGISLEDVRAFLAKTNANLPKGSLDGPFASYGLHVNDQLKVAADYRPLVAFHGPSGAIRLDDLGDVIDGVENTRQGGWFEGRPAVLLIVFKQTGANVIETVNRIRAVFPQIRRWMPPAIQFNIASDRTRTIRAAVDHVELTLVISVVLVVITVFLFLRRFWATVIPSCTVPLSLAGTFAIMFLMGYSLDNMSLMALTVAVGFVVDDAIVVIENIVRHMEAGEPPMAAALNGARQIGFTVISMSSSLVAVFIPLVFMTGLLGRLLHEFAITLTAAILVSCFVSLTFTPMMCARFLRPEEAGTKPNRFSAFLEGGFERMLGAYERGLDWVLRHQTLMLVVTFSTMAASAVLYVVIPKGFLPVQDTGSIAAVVEVGQDISFRSFNDKVEEVSKLVLKDPAVASDACFMSAGNQGKMFIELKPLSVRKMDIQAVIARLRARTAGLTGLSLFMQASQDVRIGSRFSKAAYQYTLQGSNLEELSHSASAILAAMRRIPQFLDATSDEQALGLQAHVTIDRAAAARLGLRLNDIDNTLYDAFGQRQVSTMYSTFSQHHVILEATPEYQLDPASLDRIYVKSTTGQMVPLGTVATIERSNVDVAVNHEGQFPSITLSFNLAPGYSLSQATQEIDAIAARLHLPDSVRGSFQGTAKVFEASLSQEPLLILAAVLAVYIILGILYESTIYPITILSTLPSAGVGALLAMLIVRYELSIVALIGIILLIGIVKKNAIMMIDFAINAERTEGLSAEEAIHRACLVRFRPIMMTSMAALFGALPLALSGGIGAELHKPLGISIVGGLLVSQTLTLFTTPVVYVAIDRLRHRAGRTRAVLSAAAVAPAAGAS